MGTNNLTDRSSGQVITESFFNDIHQAMDGDFVGRNSSGAPTSGQNLGTSSIPWGTARVNSLVISGNAVDTSLLTAPQNRIVSGATRSTSNQPQFITPNGAATSFTVDGASTNLVLDINGAEVTVSTDITKSSLTVGPSTTATCLVNDSDAADQNDTRTWGEQNAEKEYITVDNMGAEFQSYIGQVVAVEISGVSTEYALVYVESATRLTSAYRGYFTNSSGNPVNRTAFSDNDTITVLSTGWVFMDEDAATVDVTYTTPVTNFTAPSSPSTGDYWYDMSNTTWKRYDGSQWQVIGRTLIGVVAIDSSNCVAARSFDFYQKVEEVNNVELAINSTEIIEVTNRNAIASVYGNRIFLGQSFINWNITTDLATSADLYDATEQASTVYYLYLKDTGETVMSDISPYYRDDLLGKYHPHNPWLCLGSCYNSSGSDIIAIRDYSPIEREQYIYQTSDNTTNNSDTPSLTTTGLVPGEWYDMELHVYALRTSSGNDEANFDVRSAAGSGGIRYRFITLCWHNISANTVVTQSMTFRFRAVTNTLYFRAISLSSGTRISGNNSINETYYVLSDSKRSKRVRTTTDF